MLIIDQSFFLRFKGEPRFNGERPCFDNRVGDSEFYLERLIQEGKGTPFPLRLISFLIVLASLDFCM